MLDYSTVNDIRQGKKHEVVMCAKCTPLTLQKAQMLLIMTRQEFY